MKYLTETTLDELKNCYNLIHNMNIGSKHIIFDSIENVYKEMIDIKENKLSMFEFVEKYRDVVYKDLDLEFAIDFINERAEVHCLSEFDLKTAKDILLNNDNNIRSNQ